MSFIVAGLPRSRTAWLSVFMDAVHEPLFYCDHVSDYWDIAGNRGAADPSFALVWDRVMKERPEVPVVWIQRDGADHVKSAARFGIGAPLLEYMQGRMDEMMLGDYNMLHIQYSDINDRLEDIHNHCKPDVEFDEDRAEQLTQLIVEQDTFNMQVSDSIIGDIMRGNN